MKPGIPWSVKGVEPELREIAKSAARRSGLTLGEWLNSAINEQAASPSTASSTAESLSHHAESTQHKRNLITHHPMDRTASKLEDIAEQLARLANREIAMPSRQSDVNEAKFDFAKVVGRIESNEKQTVEAFSAVNERLATISRQIARGQATTPSKIEEQPSFQAMEKAMRNIIEHLEVSDRRNRENMKALQDRMGDMQTRVTSSNSEQLLRQAPAFSQLEQRLSDLARKIDQPQQAAPNAELRGEIEQLSGRIDTVRETAEALANKAQTQAVQAAQNELRTIETRIANLLNEAKQSVQTSQVGPAELQRFRQEFDKLNSRIDDASKNSAQDRDVSALRLAVEQLSTRVAQGPDPQPFADLDRKISEIGRKLELSKDSGQITELEKRIAELDQRLAISLNAPTPQAVAELEVKISQVDQRLARTEHQLTHLETIERAITQLYDALEHNRKQTHDIAHEAASRMANELMANQPQAAASVQLSGSPEILALEQGLHAVRAASEQADQRNQETLEAVHETLEQIVIKLAELETAAIGKNLAVAMAEPVAATPSLLATQPLPDIFENPPAPQAKAPQPTLQDIFKTPEPQAIEQDVFKQAVAEASLAAAAVTGAQALNQDAGIGDPIADARRLYQLGTQRGGRMGSPGQRPVPSKPEEPGSSIFSLPFLKKGVTKSANPAAQAATSLGPAANTNNKKRRLVFVGALILAVAFGSVMNLVGRIRHNLPADPTPQIEQVAPPQAPDTPAPAAVAPSPALTQTPAPAEVAPAPLAPKKGKVGTEKSTENEVISSAADEILTGALPIGSAAAPANPATPSPLKAATAMKLDPAVGPAKLRAAAEGGDPTAEFVVATHYLNGDTAGVDYAKAAYWYGKAAATGLAPAQYRLATLYERGKGVDRDLKSALGWYERAAELGNVKAMHNAAVLSAGNDLGQPDYAKALKWFTKAAQFGLKDSEFNLAVLLERGLGTKADVNQALFWYMAAAAQEDPDSKARVATLTKSLPAAAVAAAQAQLKAWKAQTPSEAANAVPNNDAMWNPGKTAEALPMPSNPNDKAKVLLEKMGYRVGALDGSLDSKTSNAIKLFQIQAGLKVTGQVSDDLFTAMAKATT